MNSSSRKPSHTMIRAIHGACLREDRLVVGVRSATTEALVNRGLARYWTGGVRITEDAYREHVDEARAMQRANEKTAAREAAEEAQQEAAEEEPQRIMQGSPSWSEGERRFTAVEWLSMGALGYRVSLALPSAGEKPGRLVSVADAVQVLAHRAGWEGAVVHRMGPGVVRVTSARGGMMWLRPVEEQQEAVSAPEGAGERPGAGTVPAVAAVACEGVRRGVSALLSDEERATVEAERLVPRADHVVLRVVQGGWDREAVEERRFVVGVVAALVRAGARRSEGDGVLVLRWQGETTMVRLAA
jgi:hypothetical protein